LCPIPIKGHSGAENPSQSLLERVLFDAARAQFFLGFSGWYVIIL